MSERLLSIIAVGALVLAACAGGTSEQTTTFPTAEAPEAQLLSYSLEANTEYQYQVDLSQHIEMTASGEGAGLEDEDIPGEASINVTASAVFTYSVADGPEEGTYEITIAGEFTDLEVSGMVDGEPIDSEAEIPDMADLAGMEPIDMTVIVDEQGNLIVDGAVIDDPFGGVFGDFGDFGAGLDPGQFVGPAFSDEEVTVGDTWSEEIETPGLGAGPIVISITSTVTGIDRIDAHDVYVIETNTSTSPIEFDLAEFFIGLLSAFGTPEGEAAEEFDAMLELIRFSISIDDTTSESVTWFDAAAGVVPRYSLVAATHIGMEINIPDEETGELSGFTMEMSIDQEMNYRLISRPAA